MYCITPLQYGTPSPPSSMPRLLQEMASRWYHRSVCLVWTIDIYACTHCKLLRPTCHRSHCDRHKPTPKGCTGRCWSGRSTLQVRRFDRLKMTGNFAFLQHRKNDFNCLLYDSTYGRLIISFAHILFVITRLPLTYCWNCLVYIFLWIFTIPFEHPIRMIKT